MKGVERKENKEFSLRVLCGGRRVHNRVILLALLIGLTVCIVWMRTVSDNVTVPSSPVVQAPPESPLSDLTQTLFDAERLADYENGRLEPGSDMDLPGLVDSRHQLAVIIPYRDCPQELEVFVPYIHMFLNTQKVKHKIYVINQVDKYRFNRASLINVGYFESQDDCDYLVMHDVDLLPINLNLSYAFPKNGPVHLAAPELHPLYNYKSFIGGILLINKQHFLKLNGMANHFWGWGREDDEFYQRIAAADLPISRPKNLTTGRRTFFHIHDTMRKRDYSVLELPHTKLIKADNSTGLDTLEYIAKSRLSLSINGAPYERIDVELECDTTETPWCLDPTQQPRSEAENDHVNNGDKNEETEGEMAGHNYEGEGEDDAEKSKKLEIAQHFLKNLTVKTQEQLIKLVSDRAVQYDKNQ